MRSIVFGAGLGGFPRAVFNRAMQRPWTVLVGWTVLWCVLHAAVGSPLWSWHFEAEGVRALFSVDGLHLFAAHPELQMGPLSFVAGAPFVLLLPGPAGTAAGAGFMVLIGLLIVGSLRGLSQYVSSFDDRTWMLVGLLIMMVWPELAIHWGHLDDALALCCAVTAVRAVLAGRMHLAAVLLALAVDFKPWAFPLVALLLVAPARKWLQLGGLWLLLIVAVWAPFVLADTATLSTVRFAIPISAASTLHWLGLPDVATPPWCRYAQLLGGLALAVVAVRIRRPGAVLLVAIAVRLLLDPATKNYYEAGLVLAAGIFDLTAAVTYIPLATLAATTLVYAPSYLLSGAPEVRGVVRTLALLGLAVLAMTAPSRLSGARDETFPGPRAPSGHSGPPSRRGDSRHRPKIQPVVAED